MGFIDNDSCLTLTNPASARACFKRLASAIARLLLDMNGSTSVPDIARDKWVTRQHIQKMVNELLALNQIEETRNPAHQKSSLLRLTADGRSLFELTP